MNILEEIIAYKKMEVDKTRSVFSLDEIKKKAKLKNRNIRTFTQKLKEKLDKKEIGLIAEVKKASPSKGIIREDFNPVEIALAYESGGASCLSVLTEEKYFQGDKKYIEQIKDRVALPILRKDFIVDPYQIFESVNIGADCILLIVGAVGVCHDKPLLTDLLELSRDNNLDVLMEVHDDKEMEIALDSISKAKSNVLLGINNRNLKTFDISLDVTRNLVRKYKKDLIDKVIISESGILKNEDIKSLMECGVYSFLVGESLMRENDVEKATKRLLIS